MMKTVSASPRIIPRKLADGDVSFAFSVTRHVRILGKATHIQLGKIMTLKQSEFASKGKEFWRKADKVLDDLEASGEVWHQCRLRIESAFAKHIPRPVAVAPKAVPFPASNVEIMKDAIAEIARKAEQKLAERGV